MLLLKEEQVFQALLTSLYYYNSDFVGNSYSKITAHSSDKCNLDSILSF